MNRTKGIILLAALFAAAPASAQMVIGHGQSQMHTDYPGGPQSDWHTDYPGGPLILGPTGSRPECFVFAQTVT